MEPEWLKASREERKALYRGVRQLADEQGWTLDDVLEHACGLRYLGTGYIDNFRAGRIKRKYARQIYQWLRDINPSFADRIDTEIASFYGNPDEAETWEDFLSEHGIFNELMLYPARSLSMVVKVRTTMPELVQESVPTHYPFVLVVGPRPGFEDAYEARGRKVLRTGHVMALQWMKGVWLPLPLETSAMTTELSRYGQTRLPNLSDGDEAPFSIEPHFREDAELGLCRFALILSAPSFIRETAAQLSSEQPIPPKTLNAIAAQLAREPKASWRILRLNVMFVAKEGV